jgi:hypothetical protein
MAETKGVGYSSERFNILINETTAKLRSLADTKGAEYTQGTDDRLDNFRRRANIYGVPMNFIWAIYAGKHWDALDTFIKDSLKGIDRVRSEPIDGRVHDLIVYLMLLLAILEDERDGNAA